MSKGERMLDGKYLLGTLDEKSARALIKLKDIDSVESLKHSIRDLPPNIVTDIITEREAYKTEHGTLKGFKPRDYSKGSRLGELRDMQTVGVAHMYYAGSTLLGDEVGLGKTVQIAGLVNILNMEYKEKGKAFRWCFLTEKSLVDQIRKKMIQFTGGYVGALDAGEQALVAKYKEDFEAEDKYSIVGPHSLLNSSEFLIHTAKNPFDLIVIDEGSVLKNTSSDIFKNSKALLAYHKKVIILNATPLEKNAEEFYNQLDLLDNTFLPTKEAFKRRYCKTKKGVFGYEIVGYKNTEEFKEAISLRYLARNREELGAKYVGNEYKIILVPLSKEQKVLMKKTNLYQMVYDYPPNVDRRIDFNIHTTPKAGALLSLLSKLDVVNDKALIYCRFKEAQNKLKELLEEEGYSVALLNGTSKVKERNAVLDKFLADGYDVLITNIQKGLDLNNCNNTIMYTIDPNPQKMVQFEGRMTRDFDVMYKSLFFLVSMGKEKKFMEETLKLRVEASESFVNVGKSMTIQALRDNDNISVYKYEE